MPNHFPSPLAPWPPSQIAAAASNSPLPATSSASAGGNSLPLSGYASMDMMVVAPAKPQQQQQAGSEEHYESASVCYGAPAAAAMTASTGGLPQLWAQQPMVVMPLQQLTNGKKKAFCSQACCS